MVGGWGGRWQWGREMLRIDRRRKDGFFLGLTQVLRELVVQALTNRRSNDDMTLLSALAATSSHALTASALSILAADSLTSAAVSAAFFSSADGCFVTDASFVFVGSVAFACRASAAFVGAGSVLAAAGGAGASPILESALVVAAGADVLPDALVWMYAITASTVFCGPACSQTCTLPALSMTTTPRVVLLAAFFMPMAPVRVAEPSHSRGNGRDCLAAKVVFDFGESVLKP